MSEYRDVQLRVTHQEDGRWTMQRIETVQVYGSIWPIPDPVAAGIIEGAPLGGSVDYSFSGDFAPTLIATIEAQLRGETA